VRRGVVCCPYLSPRIAWPGLPIEEGTRQQPYSQKGNALAKNSTSSQYKLQEDNNQSFSLHNAAKKTMHCPVTQDVISTTVQEDSAGTSHGNILIYCWI
jgi:hypothetical protein